MTAGPVIEQRNLKSRSKKAHSPLRYFFPPSKFYIDFIKLSLNRKLWQEKRCTSKKIHLYFIGTSTPGFFLFSMGFFSHSVSLPLCCLTFSRFSMLLFCLALVSSNWGCAWWDKSLQNWHRWLNSVTGLAGKQLLPKQSTHSYYKISWAVLLGRNFLLHEISTVFAND